MGEQFEYVECVMDEEDDGDFLLPNDEAWQLLPEMQSDALAAGHVSFDLFSGRHWIRFSKVGEVTAEVMGFYGEGIEILVRKAPASKIVNLSVALSPIGCRIFGRNIAGEDLFTYNLSRGEILYARDLANRVMPQLRARQLLLHNQRLNLLGPHGLIHPETALWPAKCFAMPTRRASTKMDARWQHIQSLMPCA